MFKAHFKIWLLPALFLLVMAALLAFSAPVHAEGETPGEPAAPAAQAPAAAGAWRTSRTSAACSARG